MSAWVCIGICGLFLAGQTAAQDKKPDVGFGIALTGPSGVYSYVPDNWGVLHVHLVNRRTEPLELLASTYFDQEPTLQYGRKVWLPPRSRMIMWHPARLPSEGMDKGTTFKFHSLVMDASQNREVLIRTDSGQMTHDGVLQVGDARATTGLIEDLGTPTYPDPDAVGFLIETCRGEQELPRRLTAITDPIFAPGEESLQSLDQLIICSNRVNTDPAGISSIRRWLFAGGHLWVMLDRVDVRFLELLLGDELQCEVVDRVSLNTIPIEPSGSSIPTGRVIEEREVPVDFVRVLVSDVDVVYTTNGWPAAFKKNVGEGRLLVTTLGPRVWMKPREATPQPAPGQPPAQFQGGPGRGGPGAFGGRGGGRGGMGGGRGGGFGGGRGGPGGGGGPVGGGNRNDQQAPQPVQSQSSMNKFVLNEPMVQMASDFWLDRSPRALEPTVLEPLVQEYIGYEVPSRWLISGLLLSFSVGLVAVGIWLWRIGRLEWLGALGPGLGIAVSLILVMIGRQQRHAVAPTVAGMEFAQTIPGTDDVLVQGHLGLFTPDSGTAQLGSQRGGWMTPDMAGQEGTTRRMIWTDLDHWEWQNLPQTAGSRSAEFSQSAEFPERISADATFGPDGLTGRIKAAGQQPEDVIIATNAGRIGVQMKADGTFTARADQVFGNEQFLAADLLSDEQNRRRQILQHLLKSSDPKRIDYPLQPQLFYWTKPWNLGFQFPPDSRALGATLVAVPLKLHRPSAGTLVSLPAPLLPFINLISRDIDSAGSMWDRRRREWVQKSAPSSTWLKFQVPKELLPVEPVSGQFTISVLGPMGKFELAGGTPKQSIPVKTWIDPVGTLKVPITDPKLLQPDATGAILLKVSGGDPDRPELTRTETKDGEKINPWQIESLHLEIKVKTR